jgi:superfamily II DNA/RNA helicase
MSHGTSTRQPARHHLQPARPDTGAEPSLGFDDLGVSEPVVDTLKMRGVDHAFPIQALVLRDALGGRDVLARSRTGSGKTLAFAIPIVERLTPGARSPHALILAPTRELASQVTEEFRAIADVKRLRVAAVYGGVGMGPQAKRARTADIVVATPGRLLDLVQRKLLRLDRVRICVLDEADRMLDMGFLPDVTRILELLRGDRQTMLFSATLDGEVGRLAQRFTHDPVRHQVREPDGPLVTESDHRFVAVQQADRTRTLVRELAADRGLTLVFVRTKRGADRLAKNLKAEGFHAGALHGGMTQGARERALGRFAAGANDVLVATDVAARGLDLEHITHVINFDPPADETDYVHRVGRTARAGRSGTGVTFVTPEKRKDVGKIATALKLQREFRLAGLGSDLRNQRHPVPSRRSGRARRGQPDVRGRTILRSEEPERR